MSSVKIDNLSVVYGQHKVVTGFSLDLAPGITFLLGRNGAGKTSLCKAIAGAISCGSGAVSIGAVSSRDSKTRREFHSRVGWMPQEFAAPAHMTVRDYVEYAAWLKGVHWRKVRAQSAEVIESVDLTSKTKSTFRSLSGGMKRRLALAGAIVHKPTFLILDEPTAGLDPEQRQSFHDTMKLIVSSSSSTVFVSTHILEDVAAMKGDIQVLDAGRLITKSFVRPQGGEENSESLRAAFLAAIQQ